MPYSQTRACTWFPVIVWCLVAGSCPERALTGSFPPALRAAEPTKIPIVQPLPYQVVQRVLAPSGAGLGTVTVRAQIPPTFAAQAWQYRVAPTTAAPDRVEDRDSPWLPLDATVDAGTLQATIRVPAGGWYRLEIRCPGETPASAPRGVGLLDPFAVGEVFLIAGQSYATNCNDEPFRVTDSQLRVAVYDLAKGTWRVAHDPQPAPDGSNGGSIWPPLGDALVKKLGVPVGLANVAVGGTSSTQWLPDGQLHPRLIAAGRSLGRFRAVLWQQGESDVIAKTSTPQYIANVRAIRDTAARAWDFDPPWLLAKSTHHPTVYHDPEGEGRIRKAIDELSMLPGFRPGPDTDTLQGENRGDAQSRRHFSPIGQRRAADMWLTVILRELDAAQRGSRSDP